MMPRSPFKIRKLIPQKKVEDVSPEDFEGSYFYHDEDEMDTLSKIKTWRPPKGLMKRSKPSIDIRRSEDLHKIICIPPLPDTPQSSTSSLCSYDNATGYVASPRSSPPRRPERRSPLASPRGSPQRSPQRSPNRSPLLLPEQLDESPLLQPRGRSPVSAHSFRDYPQLTPPSSPPQHAEMFPEPPIVQQDVVAPTTPAISVESMGIYDITPARTPVGDRAKPFSQDVMQLIQETEQAFQPQEAISNAKLSDPQLAKFPKPKQPSPLSPVAVARRKSQRRSQGSVRSSKSVRSAKSIRSPTKATAAVKATVKSPLSPAPARLPAAQPRLAATARPKRAKSKKTRRRPAAPARQSSLFQLTESAKDLFTIRIFHRLEADEMLPESTLREIRMSRAAQWTRSPELGVTHVDKKSTTTAPIEPLNLDESSTTAEGSVTPRASVTNKGAETPKDEGHSPKAQTTTPEQGNSSEQTHEPEQEDELPLQQPDSPTAGKVAGDEGEGDLPIMILGDEPITPTASTAAPQPSKPPVHRRLPSRQLPPLPTIPEIIATGPDEAVLSPTSTPLPPVDVPQANSEEYIYLQGTPFTLTQPGFMHGPIRLSKADLPISKLAANVDDTLDWTAFQMAIIGGAGDWLSESTDYSRPSEADLDELDDLYEWFNKFGFASAGALVNTPERRSSGKHGDRRRSEHTRASHVRSSHVRSSEPRTPGLSPSSYMSTPNSSPRTVGGGQRSPGIVRIDPPASDAEKSGPGGLLSNSLAGRVLTPPEYMKHRRSVSSGIHVPSSSFAVHGRNHAGLAIDSARRPSTDSMQSLPQSPMMELVLTHDIHGNEQPVPMGYNMSHDARDFLNWNAEHVFTSPSPH
ncbi:hypothetical protein QBC35DRAFT_486141 [Podospora australis]|uniref:Uncharacterized protein n=1 Tax=Podospora australis TaxID=1536484 RepID=A0AAN6X2T8_9PEZI|nr:hypothetical protein QBC35DRAFT_486141 [Podospora australis]